MLIGIVPENFECRLYTELFRLTSLCVQPERIEAFDLVFERFWLFDLYANGTNPVLFTACNGFCAYNL